MSLVKTWVTSPVSTWVSVTVALRITAPVWSDTVPASDPAVRCPNAGAANATRHAARTVQVHVFALMGLTSEPRQRYGMEERRFAFGLYERAIELSSWVDPHS